MMIYVTFIKLFELFGKTQDQHRDLA